MLSALIDSGFAVEGRERKSNWADGKWEDMIIMGVLDTEWAEKYWKTDGADEENQAMER